MTSFFTPVLWTTSCLFANIIYMIYVLVANMDVCMFLCEQLRATACWAYLVWMTPSRFWKGGRWCSQAQRCLAGPHRDRLCRLLFLYSNYYYYLQFIQTPTSFDFYWATQAKLCKLLLIFWWFSFELTNGVSMECSTSSLFINLKSLSRLTATKI